MDILGTNLYELLKAALYGLVEGITEWLPISSTGHMLLLDEFVKLSVSEEFWNLFLVVIQLGAILAVCVLFFGELNPFSRRKDAAGRRDTWKLWGKIVLACLPAAIIGIPLDDFIDEKLSNPVVIAIALIFYGILFIVIENRRAAKARRIASERPRGAHFAPQDEVDEPLAVLADEDAAVQDISELGWGRAFGIGVFQVLSLVPGTSRSGSTIIGGLILGCSRTVAAEFTFYLAIPVMFGASLLRVAKYVIRGNALALGEVSILAVGCLVAFVVSLLAIRFLMSFVKRHDFKPFGVYRILLGVAVLAYFFVPALVG